MKWTVSGGMVHVNIPHGTVALSEEQLKEMVKAINDERREGQRRDLKMPDGWPDSSNYNGRVAKG